LYKNTHFNMFCSICIEIEIDNDSDSDDKCQVKTCNTRINLMIVRNSYYTEFHSLHEEAGKSHVVSGGSRNSFSFSVFFCIKFPLSFIYMYSV
jgi:hypothetical protein